MVVRWLQALPAATSRPPTHCGGRSVLLPTVAEPNGRHKKNDKKADLTDKMSFISNFLYICIDKQKSNLTFNLLIYSHEN